MYLIVSLSSISMHLWVFIIFAFANRVSFLYAFILYLIYQSFSRSRDFPKKNKNCKHSGTLIKNWRKFAELRNRITIIQFNKSWQFNRFYSTIISKIWYFVCVWHCVPNYMECSFALKSVILTKTYCKYTIV